MSQITRRKKRVCAAFETMTRPTALSRKILAIAITLPLASSTTWSSLPRPAANSLTASGVLAIRPTWETLPPSATAISQHSK